MQTIIPQSSRVAPPNSLLALPKIDIAIRPGVIHDLPFIDSLQKKQSKCVGFMQRKALEGKIAAGEILVAWASRPCLDAEITGETPVPQEEERVGYLIGQDRYFKHDNVGIIYQLNVAGDRQRGLIGASLLKAQFERSAYGCRLYCCWCAQDIAANRFWEAMGFVPLAFRAGSRTKGEKSTPRVHIFWQKRIRRDDGSTPWWFPSQTSGGSIREDRLVLPIPPGVHWSEVQPVILPGNEEQKQITGETPVPQSKPRQSRRKEPPRVPNVSAPEDELVISNNGLRFAKPTVVAEISEEPIEAAPKPKKTRPKHDPQHIAAARELRDRWLEKVNETGYLPESAGKYDVTRQIEAAQNAPKLIAA